MALYVVPKLRTDATDFLENARRNALETFDPSNIGYCGDNFFHLCREVSPFNIVNAFASLFPFPCELLILSILCSN